MTDLSSDLQAMLENSAPVTHANTNSGRGPTGKLRNFSAMGDTKFRAALAAVLAENNDAEAIEAARAEARSRGIA